MNGDNSRSDVFGIIMAVFMTVVFFPWSVMVLFIMQMRKDKKSS